jgi:hypothetical protein
MNDTKYQLIITTLVYSVVVLSVLATGLKGYWFKPGQGDGFLRAI